MTSDFDFGAKLDDAIGGDPKELGRTRRNAGQACIETLAIGEAAESAAHLVSREEAVRIAMARQ